RLPRFRPRQSIRSLSRGRTDRSWAVSKTVERVHRCNESGSSGLPAPPTIFSDRSRTPACGFRCRPPAQIARNVALQLLLELALSPILPEEAVLAHLFFELQQGRQLFGGLEVGGHARFLAEVEHDLRLPGLFAGADRGADLVLGSRGRIRSRGAEAE